jgi:death on curing protein
VTHPEASFGHQELYPDLASKAAALGHSLIQNYPFVDGNKHISHAAMEVFLLF